MHRRPEHERDERAASQRRALAATGAESQRSAALLRDVASLAQDFRDAPAQVGHYLRELEARGLLSPVDLARSAALLETIGGRAFAAAALGSEALLGAAGAPGVAARELAAQLRAEVGPAAHGRPFDRPLESLPLGARAADPDAQGTEVVEEDPAFELANARFVGDPILEGMAQGRVAVLSRSHNGRRGAVAKVQRALVELGFDLPLFGVDGRLGPETGEAIRQFRAHSLGENEPGTAFDRDALRALDHAAPPPGERTEHSVDYARLFEDGRLDILVAVGNKEEETFRPQPDGGWEETGEGAHAAQARLFRDWLRDRGFESGLVGLDRSEDWGTTREFTFTNAEGERETRSIEVRVTLVTPGAGAAAAYGRGLAESEIAIYNGHARYGSGPDFDDKASPEENFVIGIDAAMAAAGRTTRVEEALRHGVALDQVNDLRELVESGNFDHERYRVLFFEACTSMAYLDEVRSLVGGPENVDVVGTRAPSAFSVIEGEAGLRGVEAFLDGILEMESIESVVDTLERHQAELSGGAMPRSGVWSTEGFGGNPEAEAATEGGPPARLKAANRTTADPDLARRGFRGAPGALPYRAELERSFGADLGGVRAWTGPAARGAALAMGAEAYALGRDVGFREPNPCRATVAHEVTHVWQTLGAALGRLDGAPRGHGSPEGQARAVEQAVAAGRPARSVLTDRVAAAPGDAHRAELIADETRPATVSGSHVLLEEPLSGGEVLGTVQDGDTVRILEAHGDHARVHVESGALVGRIGWVPRQAVAASREAPSLVAGEDSALLELGRRLRSGDSEFLARDVVAHVQDRLTPRQRQRLLEPDSSYLRGILAIPDLEGGQLLRILDLCGAPLALKIQVYVERCGADAAVLLHALASADDAERLAVAGDDELVRVVSLALPDHTPAQLFGDVLAHLCPDGDLDALAVDHPNLAGWLRGPGGAVPAGTAPGAPTGRLLQDTVERMRSQPAGMGRPGVMDAVRQAPRGAALSDDGRAALDEIFARACEDAQYSPDDLCAVFETRWGRPMHSDAAVSKSFVREVYDALLELPIEHVVLNAALTGFRAGGDRRVAGEYAVSIAFPGFGETTIRPTRRPGVLHVAEPVEDSVVRVQEQRVDLFTPGMAVAVDTTTGGVTAAVESADADGRNLALDRTVNVLAGAEIRSLADPGRVTLDYAVRHEVGHAVDQQVGGFGTFSQTCPAAWTRYDGGWQWVRALLAAAGISLAEAGAPQTFGGVESTLLDAAESFAAAGDPDSLTWLEGWLAAGGGADVFDTVTQFRRDPSFFDRGGVGLPALSGRIYTYFCGLWESASARARADSLAAGIRTYAYASSWEFFAEHYAAHMAPGSSDEPHARTGPAWARNYFDRLAGRPGAGPSLGMQNRSVGGG